MSTNLLVSVDEIAWFQNVICTQDCTLLHSTFPIFKRLLTDVTMRRTPGKQHYFLCAYTCSSSESGFVGSIPVSFTG